MQGQFTAQTITNKIRLHKRGLATPSQNLQAQEITLSEMAIAATIADVGNLILAEIAKQNKLAAESTLGDAE